MLPPHEPDVILRDRYQLTEIVGRGGMGCIYKASDLRLPGRLCAIKEIQPEPGTSAEDRAQLHEQFLMEASILAQLDHPNLPKVSDFFTDDDREYLVMDFVPGRDLKQLLDEIIQEGELLETETVLDWAEQIMDTLIYLHERIPPVVHRDIKPSNIKLTPDGWIKLVDFGLVKLLAPDEQRTLTVMQGRGSAMYTPLEQYGADGGTTDVRSDIYSFGATLYHLFTCKVPPDAKARFLNPRSLRPVRDLNPNVSETVSDAIQYAMAMHPDDRPATITHLRGVLSGFEPLPQPEIATPISADSRLINAVIDNQILFILVFFLGLIAFVLTIVG